MDWKGHSRYGLTASITCTGAYVLRTAYAGGIQNHETLLSIFFACLAGSLAPDLDCDSKPSKWTAMFGAGFGLWAIYAREPYIALIFLTGFSFVKTFNHRTYTHLYTLPLVLYIVSIDQNILWLTPFSIGLCVHYFCDCAGTRKLYPWDWHSWIIIPKLKKIL